MNDCNANNMLPLSEALHRLQKSIIPIDKYEIVSLAESLDRILAQDACSNIAVPNYDNSAMDGYALRAEDLQNIQSLLLIGKSFAGKAYDGMLRQGQCVRIMTGAVIPAGADTVIIQENSSNQGNSSIGDIIHFTHKPNVGDNIRRMGEDIHIGATVIQQGRRLSPADLGLLASIGIAQVTVFRKLKVALFSTGDELRLPSEELDSGCIYDSNRVVARAMLQRMNIDIVDLGIVADDPNALKDAFTKACRNCDAIITSGGVSVGEADFTKSTLSKMGEIDFWRVAIKPGKPFAFGTLKDVTRATPCYFFGLPGNPVSSTVTLHQLALPALRELAGENLPINITHSMQTHSDLKKSPGRMDFQRGKFTQADDGSFGVTTTGKQGSGILTSMSQANCYLVLAIDDDSKKAGDTVNVLPFDRWLS